MIRQKLRDLEASLRQFDGTYAGIRLAPTKVERDLEAQVHELAHASVFRINALKAPDKKHAKRSRQYAFLLHGGSFSDSRERTQGFDQQETRQASFTMDSCYFT